MAQKFYAKSGTQRLKRNPFAVGFLDLFVNSGTIPAGTQVDVEKFVVERYQDGNKRFAVLTDGDYVDADKLVSYSFLPESDRLVQSKPKKFPAWAMFAIGIAVVGGLYLGGRRLFRKR
jgi:phosphate/sulfate permease